MKKALKNKNVRLAIVCFFVILLIAVILFFAFGRDKTEYAKEYDNDGLERKSVADAVYEAKNVIGNKYENFTIPDDFEIVCGDTLYDMTEYRNPGDNSVDVKKRCKDIAKVYFGDLYDETLIEEQLNSDEYYSIYYGKTVKESDFEDDDSYVEALREDDYYNIYATIDGYVQLKQKRLVSSYDTDNPDVYIIGKDNIDGVSYNLSGTQYSISDAIEYASDAFTSDYKSFFPDIDDIVPYAVYVFTNEKGESFYDIAFEPLYQGTPAMIDGYLSDVFSPGMFRFTCRFSMSAPDKLDEISVYAPRPDEKRVIKKIITLESALLHLEERLAPESNYEITDISLNYCRYHISEDEPERSVKPYWCFTIGTGNSMWGTYSPRKVIYVDAQSGDIYCHDSMKGEIEFKYIQEKQYEKEE